MTDLKRRCETRRRVRTDVYVVIPGSTRHRLRATNLSSRGVFVEGLCLPRGTQVTLQFALRFGSVTRVHRRLATVAHASPRGSGMRMVPRYQDGPD
jgi:hypothetical protein